ncbi:hypothetical protein [Streptosporangium sp. LJ11]|uniref:hypothetical protein n=1 Tax=Streptosporangium sp. LJ11 TaxID=3436927 RepID=UPI003F796BC6
MSGDVAALGEAQLTVIQLPSYAPELNPVEAVRAHLKHSLANLAEETLNELTRLIKIRLKKIQYRPRLISGFIARQASPLNPCNFSLRSL